MKLLSREYFKHAGEPHGNHKRPSRQAQEMLEWMDLCGYAAIVGLTDDDLKRVKRGRNDHEEEEAKDASDSDQAHGAEPAPHG